MALEGHLWEKPAIPHALDDEFENTTLDPSWVINASHDYATPINPYVIPGTPRVRIHTDHRRSWLMAQGQPGYFTKPYTLPTNCLIWARMRCDRKQSSAAGYCGILFAATTAGNVSTTNSLSLWMFDAISHVTMDRVQSGSTAQLFSTSTALSYRVQCIEYVMLHKVGSTFHAWVMGQSGEKVYIGSATFAGDQTLDRVGFSTYSDNFSAPGHFSMGIDFFRVVESATYLP